MTATNCKDTKHAALSIRQTLRAYPGHGPKTSIEAERKGNIFVRHHPEVIERWLFELELRRAERSRVKEKDADDARSK